MAKAQKMRVPLSENPLKIIELADNVYKKHQAMGNNSPLRTMEDYSWEVEGPNVALALQHHKDAEELKRSMEKAYRERDKYIDGLDKVTKASRDVLTGIYRKNMKKLGDWGFTVDDTPKAKKDTTATKEQ